MGAHGFVVCALAVSAFAASGAEAQQQRPLHLLAKQCNEDAVSVRLDPRPIQVSVGPRFSLKLEGGKARVIVVAHDCQQYWMDGEDVGPTQEVQVWVAITGPEDVRPIMGAEQTPPTRTWLTLFSGSTNPRVRKAKTAAGTLQAEIEGVALDAPGRQRHGRISFAKGLKYSWDVPDAAPVSRMLGLNQDVYVRGADGNVAFNRIQALLHLCAGPSQATLTVGGGANPVPLLAPGAYPATVTTFVPMWSWATLGNAPPR